MRAESLEVLEKADVPPGQARAIVRAIEIELGSAKRTLATTFHALSRRIMLGHEHHDASPLAICLCAADARVLHGRQRARPAL